jgi:OmpA-OmpF porin, OOP family
MSHSLSAKSHPSIKPRSGRHLVLRFAALAVGALFASAAAQAQNYTPAGSSTSTFGPTYFAFNAGTADLSRPITAFGVFGGQQQGQAYGVALGNYFVGTDFGVEVSYADFGSVTRYGGSTKVDGINLSLIGRMPLGDNFNLLGKVGTTYSRTTVTTDLANANLAGSERGYDWAYGIGGEYKINANWGATLQYAEHFVKYPTTGSERISSTTFGARYYY